jgi:hypothetical protein
MKNSDRSNASIVLQDIILAVVIAVLAKFSSGIANYTILLDKDIFGIVAGIVSGLAIATYVGIVYTVKTEKMKRLRASFQFKNVLKLLFVYAALVPITYILQKIMNDFGLLSIGVTGAVIYRVFWIYWKTLSLV